MSQMRFLLLLLGTRGWMGLPNQRFLEERLMAMLLPPRTAQMRLPLLLLGTHGLMGLPSHRHLENRLKAKLRF
jgi:hypothetical protein